MQTEPFDLELLKTYLTLRYVPCRRSIFPGETQKATGRILTVEEMQKGKTHTRESELAPALLSVCKDVIRSCIHETSKKICVVTGGGIDSGATIATMSSLGLKFEAITMGFDGPTDEIADAEQLCDHFGIRLHKLISKSVLSSTYEAVTKLGVPYRGAPFCCDLAKFIKSLGFDTVVDGLGVDEFFGGYGFRYEKVLRLHKAGLDRLSAYLRGANPIDFIDEDGGLFGERLRGVNAPWRRFFPYFDSNLPLIEQIFMADYNGKCVNNFMPLSYLYKTYGIKPIYPWLSDPFIDFSLTIPSQLKYNAQTGNTKILFRKAFGELLPSKTLLKRKQGFGPDPKNVWHRELRDATEETVVDGYMVSKGYLRKEFFKNALETACPYPVQLTKCWEVYCLEKLLEAKKIA
jgi:asparagine synthetase B (glutamine-hydrolysing)